MKWLFKKVLIPTTASLVILPTAACVNDKEKQVWHLEIMSNFDDLNIIQNEDYLSKPIEAKCLDQNKQEKQLDIKFYINVKGYDQTPEWISIINNNQIYISGIDLVKDYEVSITAYNLSEKLYSTTKTFKIKVINQRHIIPDSISLEIEDDKYCMFGEQTTIPINVVPFKQQTLEKYLIKNTRCSIQVLQGISTDKLNKNLFDISGTDLEPKIVVSKETDESYIGTYKLKINANLVSNPNVFASKEITVNIDNIYEQYDNKCKCTFTRENSDSNWTISKMDNTTHIVYDIPEKIQNKPVTKIAENFSQKSNLKDLVQVILPATVTTIGANAFNNQTALCSIEIPGVKYVGENAFKNDSLLEFRNSEKIPKPKFCYVGSNAFCGCTHVKFEPQTELEWVGNNAFENCKAMTSFEIGENCRFIGVDAFTECTSLKSFMIKTVQPPEIGGGLFYKTDGFSDILVPTNAVDNYISDPDWSKLGKNIKGI